MKFSTDFNNMRTLVFDPSLACYLFSGTTMHILLFVAVSTKKICDFRNTFALPTKLSKK